MAAELVEDVDALVFVSNYALYVPQVVHIVSQEGCACLAIKFDTCHLYLESGTVFFINAHIQVDSQWLDPFGSYSLVWFTLYSICS